jgi:hypothetical protein
VPSGPCFEPAELSFHVSHFFHQERRAAPSLEKERAQSGEHLIGVDGGSLLCTLGRSAAFSRYFLHLASDVAFLL